LKNAEYMPYIVFLAAPSADVQRMMWEEGRRRGLAGKRGVRETVLVLFFFIRPSKNRTYYVMALSVHASRVIYSFLDFFWAILKLG
jgi:hypothetical protein